MAISIWNQPQMARLNGPAQGPAGTGSLRQGCPASREIAQMARPDQRTEKEDGTQGVAAFLARPFLIAVVVFLLVAGFVYISGDDGSTEIPEDAGARPSGAGTAPQGAADTQPEGLDGGTSAEDIIDNTSRSDNRPNILDAGEGPPPATSGDQTDSGPADQDASEPGPPADEN
jgi:hypothetical protein